MNVRTSARRAFRPSSLLLALGLVPFLLAACGGDDDNGPSLGDHTVYAASNSASGNQIVAFRRADDGTLTSFGTYATNGNGSGVTTVGPNGSNNGVDPLFSQGSVVLSPDKHTLLAVNNGSSTLTSFHVNDDGSLVRVSTVDSGGLKPNAVAATNSLVYVTNVGDATNGYVSGIAGYHLGSDGTLAPIAGSERGLSAPTAQPAALGFDPSNGKLLVSEFSSNNISVFPVQTDGTLGTATVNASSGVGPFGVTFLKTGQVLSDEAKSGSVSTYTLGADGKLTTVSAAVANGQKATCWNVTTPDGKFLYVVNSASGDVSSYAIGADGSVTLLNATASTLEGATSGTVDIGVSEDGKFLYVLEGGLGKVTVLAVQADGSLTKVQTATDPALPALGAEGLVAR